MRWKVVPLYSPAGGELHDQPDVIRREIRKEVDGDGALVGFEHGLLPGHLLEGQRRHEQRRRLGILSDTESGIRGRRHPSRTSDRKPMRVKVIIRRRTD